MIKNKLKHCNCAVLYRMIMALGGNFILTLVTGMFCGFFSFYLFHSTLTMHPNYFERYSYTDHPHSHEEIEEEIEDAPRPQTTVLQHSHTEIYHQGESVEAEKLAQKVRVLCWVMTAPKNHEKKAKHVKATWARRCNKFIFMSTEEDKTLDTVALPVTEGRNHLWEKTKAAFKHIYDNYLDEADWFLKADDDTYVIVENLRYMLSPFDPADPMWFGCRFKKYIKQGYMSGGAGYVLSKEALKRFVEEAIPNRMKCRPDAGGAEDVEIGKCLENVGVPVVDSRDSLGRGRFFPFVAEHHLIPGRIQPNSWFWDWTYYPSNVGMNCCSDTAVSFHYVTPNRMYEMEYFLYHLRPYGIHPHPPFPAPFPPDKTGIPSKTIESNQEVIDKEAVVETNSSSLVTKDLPN